MMSAIPTWNLCTVAEIFIRILLYHSVKQECTLSEDECELLVRTDGRNLNVHARQLNSGRNDVDPGKRGRPFRTWLDESQHSPFLSWDRNRTPGGRQAARTWRLPPAPEGLGIERHQIITAPHIRRLAETNVRQGFFEPNEFEAVVGSLPEYLQDFTRFAYQCAWRKGQIASLTWPDVDRTAGVIQARAEHVKNGRAHKIVLEGELAEIIERRWAARQYSTPSGPGISKYVFHRNGNPIRDPRKAWASACRAAVLARPKLDANGKPVTRIVKGKEQIVMVPSRIFHDLRRSGVRNMVRAGVREGVAMAISGHRTRAVFDRYNITSDEDLRQAVRQTEEHLKRQPVERKVVAIAATVKTKS